MPADPVASALSLPNGARFYRCALQVNPYEYVVREKKPTRFTDEHSYNAALVDACKQHDVEVIAVTDHYKIRSGTGLCQAARDAGIYVFPGFEAKTKDGVHVLCLFDRERQPDVIERFIGACGIQEDSPGAASRTHDALELLAEAPRWQAICIAAHVDLPRGGLLGTLSGQPRINTWKSEHLLACSLPGPISSAPEKLRPILENKNPEYRRDRPVAVINAQDVNGPEDLAKPGSTCWIKMSEVSVEGFRQAFLDPGSRIRLISDPVPEEHAEFVAIAWQGGFLRDVAVHFNENLNVLIGGRGTGKSTIIESLRYVLGLEPIGDEARKAHEGIVRQVLKSGTKISLLIRSHRPAERDYIIERTVPNPPIVRDQMGSVLSLTPLDVMRQVEVYGQHEISELARNREKRIRLLERFREPDANLAQRKTELQRELERSRLRLLDIQKEQSQSEERLAALPALEETLKRFQEAGLEERLKDQSLLVREERVLKTIPERTAPLRRLLEALRSALPVDRAFLSPKALEDLPARAILAEADRILERLSREMEDMTRRMAEALDAADAGIAAVRQRWDARRLEVQTAYDKILRELQKSRIDGEEFIHLRRQIEELRPLTERRAVLARDRQEQEKRRLNLLAEWEEVQREEFRQLDSAARKVSQQLAGRVRVRVSFGGNREPLFLLLREQVGGRLAEAIEILDRRDQLSLRELATVCREGRENLVRKFGISPAAAERLAQAGPAVIMQIEETELIHTAAIDLNVAAEGHDPDWRTLEELSTGQKATALLLLLLLESDAPLVVDQPEDDLDNRFITEGVVPKMREEKRRRQFVFATHNANVPVLADAELILGLRAVGEGAEGRAEIPVEHMGSIDSRPVRELVEEILEGGKVAFEMRRLKYGF